MVSFMTTVLGIWIYADALFWANPLNDATRPDGPMNPLSRGNLRANQAAEATLTRIFEGEETRADVAGGYDLWPILFTAAVAVVSASAIGIAQQVLPAIPFGLGATVTKVSYAGLAALPVIGWVVAQRTK
jgi:hypothetical protein